MGFLSRFEGKMEDTFEGAADRMANAPISPVQIAKKAEKQMRREKMVGAGKQYAPTLYTVLVNPDDDQRLFGYYPTLAGETETYLAAKAADEGKAITRMSTSRKIIRAILSNKAVQTAIYGTAGSGTLPTMDRVQSLFQQMFGFSAIETNDLRYAIEKADGSQEKQRFYPDNKISFISEQISGGLGTGLWGVPPEEAEYGQYANKSADQYITITQWATPDPVAVWTKASGLFIPVLPDVDSLYIATVTVGE